MCQAMVKAACQPFTDDTTVGSTYNIVHSMSERAWMFWSAMRLTVDLLEHPEHVLQVAVIQEPDGGVLVILLKRNCQQPATK